jgi:hypothetical protein
VLLAVRICIEEVEDERPGHKDQQKEQEGVAGLLKKDTDIAQLGAHGTLELLSPIMAIGKMERPTGWSLAAPLITPVPLWGTLAFDTSPNKLQ